MRKLLTVLLAISFLGGCVGTTAVAPPPEPTHEEVLHDQRLKELRDEWKMGQQAIEEILSGMFDTEITTQLVDAWVFNNNNTGVLLVQMNTGKCAVDVYFLTLYKQKTWVAIEFVMDQDTITCPPPANTVEATRTDERL